jgi:hypothetical protein
MAESWSRSTSTWATIGSTLGCGGAVVEGDPAGAVVVVVGGPPTGTGGTPGPLLTVVDVVDDVVDVLVVVEWAGAVVVVVVDSPGSRGVVVVVAAAAVLLPLVSARAGPAITSMGALSSEATTSGRAAAERNRREAIDNERFDSP